MKADPNLQFTVLQPTEPSLRDFVQMLKQVFVNFMFVLNGHIGFGDGTLPDNVDGTWVNVTSPVTPDTDFTVSHNLGRIPVGYIPMEKNKAGDVYTGSVPATKTQMTLRCSVASVGLRLFFVSLLLCLFSLGAMAQSTAVTSTVTDGDAQTWNNGTYSIVFVPNPTFPGATYSWTGGAFDPTHVYSGSLDSGGGLSVSLPDNLTISPTGTQWSISVCPNATGVCYVNVYTITGATQTITIAPPAIRINASPGAVAYQDLEVKAGLGGIYYNIGSQLLRLCLSATNGLCNTWTNVGGSGPGGVPRLDQVLNPNVSKTFNLGGTTLAFVNGSLLVPTAAGLTTTVAGQIGFDTTNNNFHVFNGVDSFVATFPVASPPTSGDLVGFLNTGGKWTLQDLGGVNSASGNSFIQVTSTNILNNDSICWNAGSSSWVNCTSGVPVTIISATSYTVNCLTDRGTYFLFTAATPIAVTLPQASTSGSCDANFFVRFRSINADVTVTPTVSTINDGGGATATLVIHPGYSFIITSDNSVYYALGNPYREGANPLQFQEGLDVFTTGGYDWQSPNNASPGTILNKMACDDGTGKLQTCAFATAATNNPVGVATTGLNAAPGTTGNTAVCFIGFCKVIFDGTVVANNFAQLSTTVNGDLHDTGSSTRPTNGQPYWYVFTGCTGAACTGVVRNLSPSELNATGNGGGKTTVQINGTNAQPIVNFTTSGGLTLTPTNSGNTTTVAFTVSAAGGYATIQNAGTSITQRTTLNFLSSGSVNVACVDNAGATRSDCTITGASGVPNPSILKTSAASYTIQNSDNGGRDIFTRNGAVAVTLPKINTIASAPFVAIRANEVSLSACTSCTPAAFAQNASDVLVVLVEARGSTNWPGVSGVPTDTAGDTFKAMAPIAINGSGGGQFAVASYYATGITATGSNTVTIHMSSSSNSIAVTIIEYAAVNFDQGASGGGLDNTTQTVTVSVAYPQEVMVGLMGIAGNPCPAGWTTRVNSGSNSGFCEQLVANVSANNFTVAGGGGGGNGFSLAQGGFSINSTPTFTAGWKVQLINYGNNLVTVTPTTSTIQGQTTLVIPPNTCYEVVSDGISDYNVAGCSGIPNAVTLGIMSQESIITEVNTSAAGADHGTSTLITVGAVDSFYEVKGAIACHGATSTGTSTLTITYTDTSSTVQTSAVTVACTTLNSGSIGQVNPIFRAKASTNIQYGFAHGGTQPTVDVSVAVFQMSTL